MNVMGDLRDNFIKMLDDSAHGIGYYHFNFVYDSSFFCWFARCSTGSDTFLKQKEVFEV